MSRKNIWSAVLALMVILFSCKKDNDPGLHPAGAVRVINDPGSATVARIEFTLDHEASVFIKYREKDGNKEFQSAVSKVQLNHQVALYRLEENTTYEYEIYTAAGVRYPGTHTFTTAAIPDWVKLFYNEAENQINESNTGYYMFTSRTSPACIYIVDNTGKIVWYRTTPNMLKAVRFTKNNTLLSLEDENNTSFGDGNLIIETTLAGDTLFSLKRGQKGFDKAIHHDINLNQRGNIVAVTTVLKDGVPGDGLIELDRTGAKIWEWTTFDAGQSNSGIIAQPWANSLDVDKDNNYIVSLRAYSQVWKINSVDGSVMWRLGKEGNIRMNGTIPFLFQHYAHRNASGDIMLFDNGSAERPLSRVLSFDIDEESLNASARIITTVPVNYYSPIMGSASLLPDNNLLVASSTNSAALKIDPQGNILWKLKMGGVIYRVEYLSSLNFN